MASTAHDFQSELQRFGLRQFRAGQREVIEAVASGADCLCIMPTGGGKSLCYQLPAVMRPGITLVVSPLIALMKDQVDGLNKLGIRAAYINSTLDASAQADRIDRMRSGEFDLVYVAPERFRSQRFMEVIRSTQVQLLAIDEAHCISEWGHDFRPDYMRIGQFRQRLGNPQTIALTATATPDVREDVVKQLGLKSPKTFIAGFARPNLEYEVQTLANRRDKADAIEQFLQRHRGSGIVYASTRKGCEEIARIISERAKRSIGVYHAGLEPDHRRKVQEDFMSDRLEIVAATNAFGMGIDKADVRFVVHFNIPGSIEAYYQEAGRAGRDGQGSTCLLLFCASDRYIQEFFIESAYPSPETVAQVYEFLRNHEDDPIEITQQALKEQLELEISAEGVGTCERLLEKSGVLKRMDPHRNMAAVAIDSDLPTLADLLPTQAQVRRRVLTAVERLVGTRRHETVYFYPSELAATVSLGASSVTRALRELNHLSAFDYVPPFRGRAIHLTRRDLDFEDLTIDFETMEKRRQADWRKLNRMIEYAKTRGCRQQEILRYFGEAATSTCNHCDNCGRSGAGRPRQRGTRVSAVGDDAILEAVRMVLSGVARTHGRFGKNVIAGMLWGSKSAKMTRWKLDRLSTFGLMKHLTQNEVILLIDALIETGLLEQTEVDRFRPVVKLTEPGRQVMMGTVALDTPIHLPQSLCGKLYARTLATPSDDARGPSTIPSRTEPRPGNDPPSVDRPPSEETPIQAECSAVQETPKSQAASTRREAPKNQGAPHAEREISPPQRPSFFWTWRLLSDGYSVEECAAIRRLSADDILEHAVRAVESGLEVDCRWLMSHRQMETLQRLIGEHRTQRLEQIVSRLPDGLRYEHVLLYLKCQVYPDYSGT